MKYLLLLILLFPNLTLASFFYEKNQDWNFNQDFGFQNTIQGNYPFNFHTGTDTTAGKDKNILSVKSGRVIFADKTSGSGGNQIEIESENLIYSYSHLSVLSVKKGDFVSEGQIIGTEGNSGYEERDSRTHLHFEIREKNYLGTGFGDEIYLNQFHDPKDYISELNSKTPFYTTKSTKVIEKSSEIKTILWDKNTKREYYKSLYRSILGREAKDFELEFWVENGTDNPTDAIYEFNKSEEARNMKAKVGMIMFQYKWNAKFDVANNQHWLSVFSMETLRGLLEL